MSLWLDEPIKDPEIIEFEKSLKKLIECDRKYMYGPFALKDKLKRNYDSAKDECMKLFKNARGEDIA
jgi:hypothetical protein